VFERAIVVVIVLLLAGGGLGLGLGLLGSFAWWLDLFAHFRIQCAGALGLALVLAGLTRRGSLAATAGLLLLADLALLVPYAIPEARPSTGTPLRLAHLNVLSSNRQHASVVAWIAGTGADLVLLQEVDPRWATVLAAVPGYRVIDVLARPDNFGLAALLREGSAIEVLAHDRPLFAGLPALGLHLRHEGRELSLLSLHTLPPVSREYAATRDAQLQAAAGWSAMQAEAGRAPVLLGDLNATPFSASIRPLRASGLRDSLAAGGLLASGSWPDLPVPLRIAIDHCWHDPGLVTVARTVGPALGSDHRPLEVSLAWAP
jgi:endonuclease/exonuclease/phosphatase (EEP) superfamily protein YafD